MILYTLKSKWTTSAMYDSNLTPSLTNKRTKSLIYRKISIPTAIQPQKPQYPENQVFANDRKVY